MCSAAESCPVEIAVAAFDHAGRRVAVETIAGVRVLAAAERVEGGKCAGRSDLEYRAADEKRCHELSPGYSDAVEIAVGALDKAAWLFAVQTTDQVLCAAERVERREHARRSHLEHRAGWPCTSKRVRTALIGSAVKIAVTAFDNGVGRFAVEAILTAGIDLSAEGVERGKHAGGSDHIRRAGGASIMIRIHAAISSCTVEVAIAAFDHSPGRGAVGATEAIRIHVGAERVEGGKRTGRSELEHRTAAGEARSRSAVEVAVGALDQAVRPLAVEASAGAEIVKAAERINYCFGYCRRRRCGRRLSCRRLPRDS